MKNTKSKLAKFVDKYWNFSCYFWISAILINVPLNIYGYLKDYEKSGRWVIIPDSDFLVIFRRFSTFLVYLGLFLFVLAIFLFGFLKIRNYLNKK